MEIDIPALESQTKAQFAELIWANIILAAQLRAAQKKCSAMEAELQKVTNPRE